MIEMRSTPRRGGWLSAWITAVLAASALVFLGFRFSLGLGDEDTDLYESPLMLSVARQLVAGPGDLYGPFGGNNPLVLIHAPLYYRLAALAAWPMAHAGLHPVDCGANRGSVAVGPGSAVDAGGGLPPGSAGRRFTASGVVGRALDRRLSDACRAAVRRPAGHGGRGVADGRSAAGALGAGRRQRCGSTRRVELHAVRSGGLREAAVRRVGDGEHGLPAGGVAPREGPTRNDHAGSGVERGDRGGSCTVSRRW